VLTISGGYRMDIVVGIVMLAVALLRIGIALHAARHR